MRFIVAIGHRVSLRGLLDKYGVESLDELEVSFEEAGLTIFTNRDDVFVTVTDKYKILEDNCSYIDLDMALTDDEFALLKAYTGEKDSRFKIFKLETLEEEEEMIIHSSLIEQMFSNLSVSNQN